MKKLTIIAFVFVFVFLGVTSVSAVIEMKPGSPDIKIDGLPCKLNSTIPNVGGTSMISTRLLAIEGDFEIKTEAGWQAFYDVSGVAVLKVKDGTQNAIGPDGKNFELAKPAYIHSYNLHVPAKQVAEVLGMKVSWDEKNTDFPLSITKQVSAEKKSWADNLISKIGSELFFFLATGLVLFFMIAFFILTPFKRKYWGQE